LGLERNELREIRWDRYETLRRLHDITNLATKHTHIPPEFQALYIEAQEVLKKAVQDDAQFAAMARAAIASGFSI
jgi:hypothetical protein